MIGKRIELQYEVLPFPLNKPFCELSHEETESFFHWYLSHIQERVGYLSSSVAKSRLGFRKELDYSPDSLIVLWTWFLSVASVENVDKNARLGRDDKIYCSKEAFSRYISNRSDKRLSEKSKYILNDIGMYLGQMFINNHPNIFWSYYEMPKGDFFVNKPVLAGFEDGGFNPPFKMFFEPIHMSSVQASKLLKGKESNDDLYILYRDWVDHYIPKR